MAYETEALFREDSYLSTAEGTVLAIAGNGGIILDRTNFYATSGGQPGIPVSSSARMVRGSRSRRPLQAKPRMKLSICPRKASKCRTWAKNSSCI